MSLEEAARVLNNRLHRDHSDWVVIDTEEGTFIEIQSQLEDYPYRFTAFEAEAIALRYLTLEEPEHGAG